ncbi:hypothetical protein BO70DRAFT_362948 [Aspergillus heteromorphus CBS 117.55]|uniref:Uncharacterized protein n=1 Tax=Aspergillus heteromorphus CBS 117.55 TaxID=1448321 RepID=A0A317W1Q5_9EURO|nr:uncharacterized protein BO70DRAFT_362948 [Aspergillus heteromorphus CBS 117.55]PWY79177.1 hypothetical protein BO70DRAFT_362948 [Aspergillus heteromorphus CBS 117.55]
MPDPPSSPSQAISGAWLIADTKSETSPTPPLPERTGAVRGVAQGCRLLHSV